MSHRKYYGPRMRLRDYYWILRNGAGDILPTETNDAPLMFPTQKAAMDHAKEYRSELERGFVPAKLHVYGDWEL